MNIPVADTRGYRLSAIDALRGLVIVIMAIDHVRDFVMTGGVQDPMSDPNVSPWLFATRWITHFCAPVFVFLAGTSAGLMAARKTREALAGFLLKRGLWLIAIEWLVISNAWTFSPFGVVQMGGAVLVVLQVIWAIGASMVVLAGAQFLGRRACLALGVAILLGHNLLDAVWPSSQMLESGPPLWVALHSQMSAVFGPFMIVFAYPLLPWIGVMLAGFGSAGVFELAPSRRNLSLLRAGLAIIAAFVLIRAVDVYGDPNGWRQQANFGRTVMDFVNTTKYPPSLSYLLMTLGPAALACVYLDNVRGWLKDALVMFGRVPFAFYVAHLFLIHALSMVVGVAQGFPASQFMAPFFLYPKGYGLGLAGVYLVWLLVLVILYPLCRWVASVKARRRDWWLSYL